MDGTNHEPNTQRTGPTDIEERYCARQEQDGSIIIYDERADDAWIRSDYTVAIAGNGS